MRFIVVASLIVLTAAPASGATGTEWEARGIVAAVAAELGSLQPQSAVDLLTAQARLEDAARLAPWYGAAYRVSGELRLEQADYFGATTAFSTALTQDPFDREARRGLAEAVRRSWLAMNFPLPYPQQVFRLVEVPEGPLPGVFLLIGEAVYWGPDLTRVQQYLLFPEVRYYAWRGRGYEETYRAPGLAGDGQAVTFARAWAGDFQQTGRPQVLLVMGWVGEDWVPTWVEIFETADASLRQVLRADSVFAPALVDLDGDGRFEVKTEQSVGVMMPRAEMGAWFDLYAYDGRQYVRANELYPAFAEEQLLRMLELEARYPDDPEVIAHVAQAYLDVAYQGETTVSAR